MLWNTLVHADKQINHRKRNIQFKNSIHIFHCIFAQIIIHRVRRELKFDCAQGTDCLWWLVEELGGEKDGTIVHTMTLNEPTRPACVMGCLVLLISTKRVPSITN